MINIQTEGLLPLSDISAPLWSSHKKLHSTPSFNFIQKQLSFKLCVCCISNGFYFCVLFFPQLRVSQMKKMVRFNCSLKTRQELKLRNRYLLSTCSVQELYFGLKWLEDGWRLFCRCSEILWKLLKLEFLLWPQDNGDRKNGC